MHLDLACSMWVLRFCMTFKLFLVCRHLCTSFKDFQGCGSDSFICHLHPPDPTHGPGIPPGWKNQEGKREKGEREGERCPNCISDCAVNIWTYEFCHRLFSVLSAQRKKSSVNLDPDGTNVEVGDQVLVAGQKHGIVRFFGKTDFAPGVSAGPS